MPPPERCGGRARGFTLLEVLIAFAITALTLAVLIQASTASLRAAATARDYQAALVRARSRLAALDGGGLVPGQRSGDDGDGFRWRTETTQLATAHDLRTEAGAATGATVARLALYAVSVTISWGERPARSVRLDSERLGVASGARTGP